jgi:hypothetical protein
MAGVWLFCDRDRVRHRIVVKLSFAHAEGRNYWQLPDRARLREEPSPADIICFKRYSFSELDVSGSMSFFGTGVQSRRLLRVWDARWQLDEMGGRTAFVVPRRDAGVGAAQASLHHPSVVSQPHDASICFGGTSAVCRRNGYLRARTATCSPNPSLSYNI